MLNHAERGNIIQEPDDTMIQVLGNIPFAHPQVQFGECILKHQSTLPIVGYSFTSKNSSAITTNTAFSKFLIPVSMDITNFSDYALSFLIAIGINNPGNILSPIAASTYVPSLWKYFCPLFQSIILKSSNGVELVSIPNVDKYSRMISPFALNYNKKGCTNRHFSCKSLRDNCYDNLTSASIATSHITDPYFDANLTLYAADDIDDMGVLLYPTNDNYEAGVAPFIYENVRYNISDGSQVFIFDYNIPLRDLLPHSLFNVDLLFPVANNTSLEIIWQPINNLGVAVLNLTSAHNLILADLTLTFTNNIAYEIYNLNLTYSYLGNLDLTKYIQLELQMTNLPIVVPFIDFASPTAIPNANPGSTQVSTARISSMAAVTSLEQIFFAIFPQDQPAGSTLSGIINNNSSNIAEKNYTTLELKANSDVLATYDLQNVRDDFLAIMKYYNCSERSYQALRYSGTVAFIFDSEKEFKKYDGRTLRGIAIKPVNDINLQFRVTAGLGPPPNPMHYVAHVTLRTFYVNNGNVYTSKLF